jgi:hypothetical protein
MMGGGIQIGLCLEYIVDGNKTEAVASLERPLRLNQQLFFFLFLLARVEALGHD